MERPYFLQTQSPAFYLLWQQRKLGMPQSSACFCTLWLRKIVLQYYAVLARVGTFGPITSATWQYFKPTAMLFPSHVEGSFTIVSIVGDFCTTGRMQIIVPRSRRSHAKSTGLPLNWFFSSASDCWILAAHHPPASSPCSSWATSTAACSVLWLAVIPGQARWNSAKFGEVGPVSADSCLCCLCHWSSAQLALWRIGMGLWSVLQERIAYSKQPKWWSMACHKQGQKLIQVYEASWNTSLKQSRPEQLYWLTRFNTMRSDVYRRHHWL